MQWIEAVADPDNLLVETNEANNTTAAPVVLSADADSDGLPDQWERRYFGNLGEDGAAAGMTGPVVKVHDGDTLTVLVQNREVRIRLVGIDAPEAGQPFGERSKLALSRLVFGKIVRVIGDETDQYGRILGRVLLGSDDINVAMVRAGMVWQYRYSRDRTIEAAQAAARTARRGLWADANPVDPWEWRTTTKRGRSDSAVEHS